MTADLAALFDHARATLEPLIDTSGTTVDIERPPAGESLLTGTLPDPDTLVSTPTELEHVAADLEAILAPMSAGLPWPDLPAPVDEVAGDYRLLIKAAQTDLAEGDLVRCATCLDPRMVGRTFLVRQLLDSSAAVCRLALLRPVRLAG